MESMSDYAQSQGLTLKTLESLLNKNLLVLHPSQETQIVTLED